ncbi:MAG: cytochrome, partial [Rhizobiaceae bacterium]|nr:cytochrome [Rhizobiaceae bacterium]
FVAAQVSFGDRVPKSRAVTLGFGPDGLRRLGLEGGPDEDPLDRFPVAFRHGMGNPSRSRILDDVGDSQPQNWKWGSPGRPVDLVLFCYASSRETLKADVGDLKRRTLAAGMKIVAELPLRIRREGKRAVEHFGFADGVSQPVVRGTARANTGIAPMHLVAPGEFLFGYRDEHGFYPASPGVRATHDRTGMLPALRFRQGADGTTTALHDFGRNGSFLVVRQFEQHVEAFEDFCAFAARTKAAELSEPGITPRWIAAKMVGRWQDGSSLVRNPEGRPGRPADNDFSFGAEDPQGHRCPLGAHIRRSNPRDSLGDDHETQIRIGKRHRILRVGRTYEKPAGHGRKPEKGLLFMCLNADIERQYEFMQQTWVAAGFFLLIVV